MKYYSPDQIFDLLGVVECQNDLIRIDEYFMEFRNSYKWYDQIIIENCIEDLYNAFNLI